MKRIFFPSLALLALFSCESSNKPLVKDATTETKTSTVALPLEMTYKGTPAIGKNENVATVMKWNKAVIDGQVDEAAAYMADSLTAVMADGTFFNLSRDSAVAVLKDFRNSLDSIQQQYITAVPVDNTDAGDEWVLQWTTETYWRKGKKEVSNLNETYLMKEGKIRQISQYAQQLPQLK